MTRQEPAISHGIPPHDATPRAWMRTGSFCPGHRSRCRAHAILAAALPLLYGVDLKLGVRLLGISVSNFTAPAEQLSLDDIQDWESASGTVDAIRERFGTAAIGPASAVCERGLRLVRKGAQQFGPDAPEHGA